MRREAGGGIKGRAGGVGPLNAPRSNGVWGRSRREGLEWKLYCTRSAETIRVSDCPRVHIRSLHSMRLLDPGAVAVAMLVTWCRCRGPMAAGPHEPQEMAGDWHPGAGDVTGSLPREPARHAAVPVCHHVKACGDGDRPSWFSQPDKLLSTNSGSLAAEASCIRS